jgi:chitin disaccharide deacetylase
LARNPTLATLGYGPDERVVVIHADDFGMYQSTLPAVAELFEFGLVSSASAMVPCASFPDVACFCRARPQADVGVHLTLTSEWTSYRWGPISMRDRASGLIYPEGYFWSRTAAMQEHANYRAVEVEIHAQVDRALAAGVDVTHIDSHMFSGFHPNFVRSYAELAVAKRTPLVMSRRSMVRQAMQRAKAVALRVAMMMQHRIPAGHRCADTSLEMIEATDDAQRLLRPVCAPLFDNVVHLPLNQPNERIELAKQYFDQLKPGLTHLAIHPAKDTPELRAITPDLPSRIADHQAFCSPVLRDHVRKAGIQVVGYQLLRDTLRSGYEDHCKLKRSN